MPQRILSPTGGRDIANRQHAWVDYVDDGERIRLQFADLATGNPATLHMTPQIARHLAYLFIMAATSVDGRLGDSDIFGFEIADAPAAADA